MAQGIIPFIKDSTIVIDASNKDLDDYIYKSDSGFYYTGTGSIHSPGNWNGMIMIGNSDSDGTASYQLSIAPDGSLHSRARTGNPPNWGAWNTGLQDTDSTSVTASFHVGNLDTSSTIFAYKNGNVLIISGYLRSTVEISQGTKIASVSATCKMEVFASPISDNGDGTRLVLHQNGTIFNERRILANNWYSFTLVTFTK